MSLLPLARPSTLLTERTPSAITSPMATATSSRGAGRRVIQLVAARTFVYQTMRVVGSAGGYERGSMLSSAVVTSLPRSINEGVPTGPAERSIDVWGCGRRARHCAFQSAAALMAVRPT